MNIFPKLLNKTWGYLNLNKESKNYSKINFNNPIECEKWVESIHNLNSVDYSYGGFLEDRSYLWRGSYLDELNAFIHLGVDFNVPVGTRVALPIDARVENIVFDPNQNGGWGAGIKLKILNSNNYLVFAHLSHKLKIKIGDEFSKGEIIAKTGKISENGGWYPHLHVQVFNKKFDDAYSNDLDLMDGYLPKKHPHLKYVINPMDYIKLKK